MLPIFHEILKNFSLANSVLIFLVYIRIVCIYVFISFSLFAEGCPRGVMIKAIDCGIVVSEFELQSRYYVYFRTNNLGKGMKPLVLPAMS